jgi:hypothetical protein
MIAHQDEFEHSLVVSFNEIAPDVIGNDYLILGTVDKATCGGKRKNRF